MNDETNNSLKNRAMKGFFWMFSGSGIQSMMQFVVLIVLARLLDSETFGIASAALVVISFVKIFATIGLGPAIVQREKITNDHIGTSFVFSIFIAAFLSIVVFFSSSYIADFFHMGELNTVLKIMSVMFILEGITQVSESLIQRDLRFNLLVRIQVISYLFYGVVGTTLALMGLGIWSLVFAHIIKSFVKAVLSLYLQPYKIQFKFHFVAFKELFYFSVGDSLTQISGEFTKEGDNFIVGRLLGAESLGLYSRAYQLMVTPASLLGKVLDKILFPVVSKIQHNQARVASLYQESVRIATTLMFPGSLFIAINAENIILLLFGEKWLAMTEPFQILALSLLFRSSHKIGDTIIKAKGVVYYRAMINWIYAGMVLLFVYIGGQIDGLPGVAFGVLIASLLHYVFITILAVRVTKVRIPKLLQVHGGGVILALLVWISSVIINDFISPYIDHFLLELLISIVTFLLIYLFCFLLFPTLFIGSEGRQLISNVKKMYTSRIRKR